MKGTFQIGDVRTHHFKVTKDHLATFESGPVHPVCSTFILAREMEWSSRLFLLDMCEADEEGVGTMLQIEHKSPAFVGEELNLEARVMSFAKNELICGIEVKVGERLVATGKTGQKIMSKDKITQIFTSLER
ncbi:hypothetical protein BFP97_09515 [Roseivirga sp. 4D4]|uniref:thioesterase family protein n=1 Tax=Roseivirga sp. 4D4 TaxID=1889784 RepID=UPI000852B44B|nr:hotdog domain-containing protein [Roseivirga sp. 4D4]OEK01738.1 hypothetical protein BFP97_09515 [Roseivirga sp. 4D4]